MNVPNHIAVIMDGNGRWAQQRGKKRSEGHAHGVQALHDTLKNADALGVKYLTVYAFSTENWRRPDEEVAYLMNLFAESLAKYTPEFITSNVQLRFIGDLSRLSEETRSRIRESIKATEVCNGITLIVALSYSARWELNDAFAKGVEAYRQREVPNPYDDPIAPFLQTAGIPDPDLLIRTGGEQRLSNFLLYQTAYTELYFTDVLWPDFCNDDLMKAVQFFNSRERRFGALPDTETTL